MTPEDRAKLDAARSVWRTDPRHQETCTHANATGGGGVLFFFDGDGQVWNNAYTCNSCKSEIKEIEVWKDGKKETLLRTVNGKRIA